MTALANDARLRPAPSVQELRARAAALLARDRWPRERLLAHQQEALRALLRDAADRSPYYRELLGPVARAESLSLGDLPTLPKATLMEQWDRIVTDPRLQLLGVEQRLGGPDAGEPYLGEYRLFTTAGSRESASPGSPGS
jgi:phenylacetate-CoA ligase